MDPSGNWRSLERTKSGAAVNREIMDKEMERVLRTTAKIDWDQLVKNSEELFGYFNCGIQTDPSCLPTRPTRDVVNSTGCPDSVNHHERGAPNVPQLPESLFATGNKARNQAQRPISDECPDPNDVSNAASDLTRTWVPT